jgi:signal transduction histidine kinase
MPLMDGISMCRELRKHEETKATPVLLLTAHGRVNVVLDAFEAGADDYLTKPFHGRELLARVSVHVRLRRMVWQAAHRERLASVGVLAATVAHEARNGLTSLVGGLPAMKRRLHDKIDPSTHELLDVMIASAQRIERLTTDLLDLSRVDRVSFGPYRPGAGLMASLRLMSAKLSHKVTLTSNVDEGAIVIGRAGDMNHVFMNLIDNAGKAVGESGQIRVEGRIEGQNYVVQVEDSGDGVDPQFAFRIFEPFVTTRPAGEGTGLGLAIAKEVIEQHGGTISVDRSELGGARFMVQLPCASEQEAVVA